MRLFITGATGFLGSHLLPHLAEYDILCACVPGSDSSLSSFEDITVVYTDDPRLHAIISAFSPDVVINIAGVYDTQPFSAVLDGNLVFPVTLLELLSSSELQKWININTSLDRMLSSYALAKNQLADWGKYFSLKCGFSFVNVQLEQFYGAFDGRFISYVMSRLLENEPLSLTECLQKRDLIHVSDVCRALVHILKTDFSGKYLDIPVGCGVAPQLREVIEFCREITDSTSQINYGAIPVRQGEPTLSVANIAVLSEIGFHPTINWRDGLKNVMEEMKK